MPPAPNMPMNMKSARTFPALPVNAGELEENVADGAEDDPLMGPVGAAVTDKLV